MSSLYSNASSSEKVFWSESGDKSAQIKHCLQAKTVQNSSKQICGWILMWETTGDGLFHWRKHYYGLWTHSLVKNVLMGFISYKQQILSSQDVNWWTGVEWITCGLLWCFYQLFGLSFWRHPFTAEDPLNAISPNLKLIYIFYGLRVRKLSANLHFWKNHCFKEHQQLQQEEVVMVTHIIRCISAC